MATSNSAQYVPGSTVPTTDAARARNDSIRAKPAAASSSASNENSTCDR